jgi:hypothetical protein
MTFTDTILTAPTVVSSTGIQVATTQMFDGRNLSDVSGSNGLSGPDFSDFAFIAGSTAAGGWAAIPHASNGGAGRLTDMKENATQRLTDGYQQSMADRDEARKWAQADKDGTLEAKVKQQTADEIKPLADQVRKDAVADHLKAAGGKAADPTVQREAAAAGKAAAKKAAAEAEKAVGKKIATRAAEMAAKKSAALVAKQAGLRAAALAVGAAIPGPGWLVAAGFLVGSLMIDPETRNMITGIFASGMDANQPPVRPTTTWLPATDDNRKNDIRQADAKLAALNTHISGIDPGPHKLWHLQDSEVPALTNMSAAVSKLNEATAKAADVSANYTALLNSAPDQWGEKLKAARRNSAQVISEFGPKAGAPMAAALTAAASAGNDAYQQVREGNAKARQQLANSHGRFLGFIGGGYGADNLAANIPVIEDAARGVAAADKRISDAVRDWTTAAVRSNSDDVAVAEALASDHKTPENNGKSGDDGRLPAHTTIVTAPSSDTGPLPKPGPMPPQGLNTPFAAPTGTPMGMGPMGGAPFGGGTPPAGPKPLSDIMSNLPEPPKKKGAGEIRDDEVPPKEKDSKKGKLNGELPDEPKPDPKIAPAADHTPHVPNPDRPGPPPHAAPSAVVNIEGMGPVDFKDPKIAELVQKVQSAEAGAPVTVRAGAQELGIPIGAPGKDIGPVVPPGDLEPGNIVSSSDGKDYIYVGEDKVFGEDKKLYPLSKAAAFDNNTDGLFRLDTGFHPDQPAAPGSDGAAATPPAGPRPQAGAQPVIVPADRGPSGALPADPPPPGSIPGTAPIDPKNILP